MKHLLAVVTALFVPTLVVGQQPAPKEADTLELKIVDSRPAPKPKAKLDTLDVSTADGPYVVPWCQIRREPLPGVWFYSDLGLDGWRMPPEQLFMHSHFLNFATSCCGVDGTKKKCRP